MDCLKCPNYWKDQIDESKCAECIARKEEKE